MRMFVSLFAMIVFLVALWLFWFAASRMSLGFIDEVDHAGIVLGYLLSCFYIAIAVYAWLRRKDIRRWLRRTRFESVGAAFQVPAEKVTAAVIPVSPRREQPEWILRWLEPRHVGFLYTELSKQTAKELVQEFSEPSNGFRFFPDSEAIAAGQFMLADADDPRESKELVQSFLRRFLDLGIPHSEIFVDTTGGKVPMSIGAFQAAEELGISSIYVVGNVNGVIKDPKVRDHGSPVFMSDHRSQSS